MRLTGPRPNLFDRNFTPLFAGALLLIAMIAGWTGAYWVAAAFLALLALRGTFWLASPYAAWARRAMAPPKRSRFETVGRFFVWESRRDAVARAWRDHADLPFPARLRGQQLAGIDLVRLDADIAGCVSTWVGGTEKVDAAKARALRSSLTDLDKILPLLTDEAERAYYERLRDMARRVLDDERA